MGFLICIILIIVIIVQEQRNEKQMAIYLKRIEQLKQENKLLREAREKQINQSEENVERIEQVAQVTNVQSKPVSIQAKARNELVKEVKTKKSEIQKEVIKNNAILAVGSIFIVVAAISFLYTGWDVLHNALKIGVLGILAVVFLMLSHIAKHKLNLPQTSKAFFYIAMGYIPIVLFSLSLLDLIGEYFSISGDGRFIYLFGASIFIMILYYAVAHKFKDYKMQIAAHCMQTVVMVFGLLTINLPKEYFGICFVIHALVFNLLADKLNEFKAMNRIFGLIQGVLYTTVAIALVTLSWGNTLYLLISSISIMALYYLLDTKFEKIPLHYVGHAFQSITIFFACLMLDIKIELYPIVFLIHSLILSKFSKDYYATILFGVYAFFSLFFVLMYWGTPTSLIIAILYVLNTLMIEPKNEEENLYKFTALKAFSYFLVLVVTCLEIKIGGDIFSLPWLVREVIWTAIIVATSVLYLKNPNIKFAQNGFIINYVCLVLMSFIPSEVSNILIPANAFTLLGFAMTVCALKVLNLKEKNIILNSVLIYTLFRILIDSSLLSHFIYFVICAFSLFLFETKEEFSVYRYIPLIAYWLKLCKDGVEIFEDAMWVPIVFSVVIIIGLEFLSFVRVKKNEPYVIMSFFYMLLPFGWFIEQANEYVFFACMAFWALVNLIVTIDTLRIIIKGILSFSLFMLYMMFAGDYAENIVVLLMHLGIITYMHFITRKMFGKRIKNYKLIEYVGLVIIYLTAISSITEPAEGLLYLGMLTFFVIIAYSKKIGPLFLTSVIAMIVKLLDLTQDFWLAIPWWLYILGIGAVMVTFSMKNEKKNRENRIELKEKIKAAREYLDM
ncbi:MAG: DUF2157 domain-containing protein [Clostridia bacterium]|nr:DUF2157 domain-containing protein [Clostridia bacterium]